MGKVWIWAAVGVVIAFVISFALSALAAAAGGSVGATPWIVGCIFGAFVAYIGANLAGNRRTPQASREAREVALRLKPGPGEALVVVYREAFVGMAAGMNVRIDGVEVAQLKAPRFTAVTVSPGVHEIILGFGGLAGPQNNQAVTKFDVADGGVAAFRATLQMGAVKNSIRMEKVDEREVGPVLARLKMTAPDVARV